MHDYTLGQLNRREDCAAPDLTSTFDEPSSSSDGFPLLMHPNEEVQQWIDRLLAAPISEPAMLPLPSSFAPFAFAPFDYAPPFDAQPLPTDSLLVLPPTLDPRFFPGPFDINSLHSPSLDSQSGSSAAPASPASVGPYPSFDPVASLSPTSWPLPIAPSPPSTATTATTPAPPSPAFLEALAAESEAADLGLDLVSLQAKLDPAHHAALYAAIKSIAVATVTDGEKPPKEALFPLLREVSARDKKDRRWFCRFRDCRWAEAGYNRSDRAIAHLLKDHFGTRFECKEAGCGREFKWRHDLQAHVRRDHAPDGIAPTRVLCQYCGKDFSKKSNLDRHLREGICPSFGGGPGKVKSKAPRTRRSKAATLRANIKPDEYDDDDF